MKSVILAGGLGTRSTEETWARPKSAVEIGGKPVLPYVVKLCSAHGINDFIICVGYKDRLIKGCFCNCHMHGADVCPDLASNAVQMLNTREDPLERLAVEGQLGTFRNYGSRKHMDALRDKQPMEGRWQSGNAPWKTW